VIALNCTKLKEIRENHDLTQRELSELLLIGKSTYARWETEEQIIPLSRLNDFCNFFHVSMDYAIGLSQTNKETLEISNLDIKAIGRNLKKIRKEHHLTQEKLATLLNTTHSTISAYENGKTLILTVFALEICKNYNYSLDWLCNKEKK